MIFIASDNERGRLRGPWTFVNKDNSITYEPDSRDQPHSVWFNFSDAIKLPRGTTAQRPVNTLVNSLLFDIVGSFRFNTSTDRLEYVQNDSTWKSVANLNDAIGSLVLEDGLQLSNDTLSISPDSLGAWSNPEFGQGVFLQDVDSTLSITGYSVTVRAEISASPGSEFTITLPAASADLAGRTVTIVETDANTGDSNLYNIVPASGNFYGSDGAIVGTTTITNETKIFRCMPIDGSSWALSK